VQPQNRNLEWDGFLNARDLGGLKTKDSSAVRWGAVVRSENLNQLSQAGWDALWAHGVRTIIDLRNDDEREVNPNPNQAKFVTVHVPIDDVADTVLWDEIRQNRLNGSPLYYKLFLERKPERCAAAIAAVAAASPGGVLIHCGAGRSRTGLISLLLLAFAGVAAEDISADYALSTERLKRLSENVGQFDEGSGIQRALESHRTTAHAQIVSLLEGLNVAEYLHAAGVSMQQLNQLKNRLLETSS
jgi:protein-tyrosine phosphatase